MALPFELDSDHQIYGVTGNLYPLDVRFDPANAAHCSRLDPGRLFFMVSAEAAVAEGLLVVRRAASVTAYELKRFPGAGRFTLWEAVLDDPGELFEYSFAFRTAAGAAVYLAPSGITNAIERIDRWTLDPSGLALHEVPAWARGVTVYQIFPDRFAVGDVSLNPPRTQPWGSQPRSHEFQGGDLVGIIDRADYLAELGIGAVYLNPIFTSPSNHRYDAIDYYAVDPALGGNEALRTLVDAMHDREIRVILDTSLNHCHPRFFAFADIVTHGPSSRYNDWFAVRDFPPRIRYRPHLVDVADRDYWETRVARLEAETGLQIEVVEGEGSILEPTYDTWYGVPTMPRVNLQQPDARRYMLDVATHWVKDYDIDGWRMDVTRYVDVDFWDDFRQAVRSVKPECYLVAEVMGDAGPWLQGDRFDATMNYTFRDLCLGYFATSTIDTLAFLDGFTRMSGMYSPTVTAVNLNLLSSHDTPRFLTEAGGDHARLLLATLFQLTVPGAPSIYYGDELGMTGGGDPLNRGAFPREHPDDATATGRLWRVIRDLVHLRRDSAALREGTWELVDVAGEAFSYRRVAGAERIAVAINMTASPVSLELGESATPRIRWGEGTLDVEGSAARVAELPPMGGVVVEL